MLNKLCSYRHCWTKVDGTGEVLYHVILSWWSWECWHLLLLEDPFPTSSWLQLVFHFRAVNLLMLWIEILLLHVLAYFKKKCKITIHSFLSYNKNVCQVHFMLKNAMQWTLQVSMGWTQIILKAWQGHFHLWL